MIGRPVAPLLDALEGTSADHDVLSMNDDDFLLDGKLGERLADLARNVGIVLVVRVNDGLRRNAHWIHETRAPRFRKLLSPREASSDFP